jgi:hypothetical protein
MAEERQSIHKPESRNLTKLFTAALPLLFLATPSLWLIWSVPPLWKDVDAYNQTVRPPGLVTILLHGPLYCTLSRVPLWFGYLISGSEPAASLGHFIKHSQLTDAGVYSLVVLQHIALWCGAVYLIYAIARTLLLRLLFTVLFASQPMFYGFAHCVGSEALSMIIILLLAASGARLMLHYPDVRSHDWIIFTILLAAACLTRHINCVLAAVLPITMTLIMFERGLRRLVTDDKAIAAANVQFSKAWKLWLISIATGLIGLFCATTVTHFLCWRAHTPWRSTFGYTFLWRFNFLEPMQPTSRRALLDLVASKCRLPESRQLLELLAAWIDRNKHWEPGAFIQEAHSDLSESEMKYHSEKFDRVLNEIASGFLYPPAAPIRSATLSDFTLATRSTQGDIIQFLFVSTDYFFSHRDKMPQCSGLKTFREPRDRLTGAREMSYFHSWNLLSCRAWSIVGLIVLLSVLVVHYKRVAQNTPLILFAVCLWIVGMAMVLLNCFLAQLQPRFVLPMMELVLLSLIILLGVLFNGCESPNRRITNTPALQTADIPGPDHDHRS